MPKISIIYEPDISLGTDPNDPQSLPRARGEFIDTERYDALVFWMDRFGNGRYMASGPFNNRDLAAYLHWWGNPDAYAEEEEDGSTEAEN